MNEEYHEEVEYYTPAPSVWKILGQIFLASLVIGLFLGMYKNVEYRHSKFLLFIGGVLGSTIAQMIAPLFVAGVSWLITIITKRVKPDLTKTLWVTWAIVTAISVYGQIRYPL